MPLSKVEHGLDRLPPLTVSIGIPREVFSHQFAHIGFEDETSRLSLSSQIVGDVEGHLHGKSVAGLEQKCHPETRGVPAKLARLPPIPMYAVCIIFRLSRGRLHLTRMYR